MNKEEKIGLYTEDEIFDYMTNREGSMLGRSMYDAIFEKIHTQKKENTNLKQALNEIRKYVNSDKLLSILCKPKIDDKGETHYDLIRKDILQIIDKILGDDEK